MAWNQAGNSLTSDICFAPLHSAFGRCSVPPPERMTPSGAVGIDARRRRGGERAAPSPLAVLADHTGADEVGTAGGVQLDVEKARFVAELQVRAVDVEAQQAAPLIGL